MTHKHPAHLLLLTVFMWTLNAAAARSCRAGDALPITTELRTLTGAEFKKLRNGEARIDLIDVRAPADYRKLHLVGARNVPFYVIGQAGISKKNLVVLYCSDLQCNLSGESARALLNRGYKNVQIIVGGLEAALAAGCSVEGEDGGRQARRLMKTAELAARLASATPPVLLDVRPPAAFAAGHLTGALNIPLEKLKERSRELPADRAVVLYDSSVDRAGRAAGLLGGGREVWELEGGIALWTREARPLISGTP